MADNRKINHEKGMLSAAAQTFPFLNENSYFSEDIERMLERKTLCSAI